MFFKLKDFKFQNKKVLIRVDFNVPVKNGIITDDSRIKKALPTIKTILDKKPKQLIIISHFGRPNGEYLPEFSLGPICNRFKKLLGKEVHFETNPRINNITSLPDAQIVMLENLRFDSIEVNNNENFAKKLSQFADYFVLDAFGASHRSHASITGVQKFIPSCAGLLMNKEIKYLKDEMQNPAQPFVAIIGGAKADKLNVVSSMLEKVDLLIIGGVLANTFLKAIGKNIGMSKFDKNSLELAKQLNDKYSDKIALPVDYILADNFSSDANTQIAGKKDNINNGIIMDIGPYTISGYIDILRKAKTIVWAGPIGVFEWEKFRRGTWDIARTISECRAVKIIGGGDSADAINMFNLSDKMTHISTGGGACLELLANGTLPGIEALEKNFEKFKDNLK